MTILLIKLNSSMQIDIGASIAALLYEHKSVSIPGLGSFLSNYKPATIDQVEGKIHPPAKEVTFNKNLLLDDGLLVQHIRRKYNVTYPTAMNAIEEFVKQANETIARRDIFTIKGVGRLYKDFEENFQFLPDDDVNFNTESYGLPTVQFYPVAHAQRTTGAATQQPKAKTAAPAASTEKRRGSFGVWLRRNVVGVSSVLVVAIAVVVYFQFFHNAAPVDGTETAMDDTRYNVSPSRMTSDTGVEESLPSAEKESAVPDDDDSETDGATLRPEQQYVTIAVGMFGDPDNVERLVKRIYEAGYEPYTEPNGKLTRVGIQMTYDTEQDIQNALKDIRVKFNKDAQILKRHKK